MSAMPINIFDCLLVAVLLAGMVRGRKQGVSNEGLRALRWVLLAVGCGLIYRPVGALVCGTGFFDALSAYLLSYLGAALLIFFCFSVLERRAKPKLEGTDIFGRGEYYLGMGAGALRYACMTLMVLAVLNARAFTSYELKAIEKAQLDSYGSSIFPTWRGFQETVFERSFSGPCIRTGLGFLLIDPTEAGQSSPPGTNTSSRLVRR